jgi:signal transduction histidine kinase
VVWETTAAAPTAETRAQPDVVRRWVPLVAVAVAVVAAVTDPGGWPRVVAVGVAVATFGLWARVPRLSTVVLTVGVAVPVVFAQLSGQLEPALFLVALLAVVVAAREDSLWRVGLVGIIAAASPVLSAALQPAGNHLAWGSWTIGMAFSTVIGRGTYRQQRLLGQLEAAHRQLARQAQAEERRRIARDVHDLVGQGLSAVLLQVTSARHVLRRDTDAADAALGSALDVGRRSMQELRGTMALLRTDDDTALASSLPDFAGLGALVESARTEGLHVEYRSTGDLHDVSSAVGLALYRIAQEALVNAAQHASHARTVVVATVAPSSVTLEVRSVGPLAARPDPGRPRYGLVGMRERAATVGAELQAGPTPDGWCVSCRVEAAPS